MSENKRMSSDASNFLGMLSIVKTIEINLLNIILIILNRKWKWLFKFELLAASFWVKSNVD